jgi:hypothetical protein
MNSMWSKRGVLVAIVVTGAVGRLAGCATMGSSGKMMYEPPFLIAESNDVSTVTMPTSRPATAAIGANDRVRSSG